MQTKYIDELYEIAQEIVHILAKHSCSIRDHMIIYNMIMGYPYSLGNDDGYFYGGKFYATLAEMPEDGRYELSARAHGLPKFGRTDFDDITFTDCSQELLKMIEELAANREEI